MKSISAAVVALCSVACLTWAPHAEAGGAEGFAPICRVPTAELGDPTPILWGPTSGSSPYNPGLVTANTATLVAGSTITTDQDELAITSAIQYVYYSSPIPPASDCAANPSR